MPSRERVAAFIASVVGGDHVRAIADYHHDEAYDAATVWAVVEVP
jgi:hypothetical protein